MAAVTHRSTLPYHSVVILNISDLSALLIKSYVADELIGDYSLPEVQPLLFNFRSQVGHLNLPAGPTCRVLSP
ncbi:MAG: hypothetical protein P8L44_11510 [Opitutales bacterium]|jgi:hypothetical protein|nr:hypothetical protein [Opitutales bacterium]